MFVEILAAIILAPFVLRFFRGCVLGLVIVIAAACAGYYGPLIICAVVLVVTFVVVKLATRERGHTASYREHAAAAYSFAPSSLRADFGQRLDRTRRWSSR